MDSCDFYIELGQNIRAFRKMRLITQKQLAFSIHKSLACVSKYEKGDIAVDVYTLQAIALQLGITMEQLLPRSKKTLQRPAEMEQQFHPMFKNSLLYLYWYRGGKQALVRHVIELAPETSHVTCFMEVKNISEYKNCAYMMRGTLFHNGVNTYIYATNSILPGDFIFACFNGVDLLDSYMVGLLCCMNRSCHITTTKCFITNTPLYPSAEILQAVMITKGEISELKRSNFFTFGTHQQQY